tara:strand:+ start:1308 stop:1508 length:201 start_codon:yes stop_codon:yes gene_type:complete
VAEDDRVALFLQVVDRGDRRREDRPLDFRNDPFDFGVERCRSGGDFGRVGVYWLHRGVPEKVILNE